MKNWTMKLASHFLFVLLLQGPTFASCDDGIFDFDPVLDRLPSVVNDAGDLEFEDPDEVYSSGDEDEYFIPGHGVITFSDEDGQAEARDNDPSEENPIFYCDPHESEESNETSVTADEPVVAPVAFPHQHLSTYPEHQTYLLSAIAAANKSLRITCKTFNALVADHPDLYKALKAAAEKGIKIHFYSAGIKDEAQSKDYFKGAIVQPKFHKTSIHSKIIIVDGKTLALGSFNWLEDKKYGLLLQNESIALEEAESKLFIPIIKSTLKSYLHVTAKTKTRVEVNTEFKDRLLLVQKQIDGSQVELITTPHRHRQFFKALFENTKKRLIICAPFVSTKTTALEDIMPIKLVEAYLKSGKILQILHSPMDDEEPAPVAAGGKARKKEIPMLERLTNFLKPLMLLPTLFITQVEHMHQKTVVADDCYTIGSFNWTSSAGDILDTHNLNETTVVLQGPITKDFINRFETRYPKVLDPKKEL